MRRYLAVTSGALLSTTLAVAGCGSSERQRQRSFGSREPDLASLESRNTGLGAVRGTAYRLRWPGGRRTEIFNGITVQTLEALGERRAGDYLSAARAGRPRIDGDGDEIFIQAGDGTVTGFRLLPGPRNRRRI